MNKKFLTLWVAILWFLNTDELARLNEGLGLNENAGDRASLIQQQLPQPPRDMLQRLFNFFNYSRPCIFQGNRIIQANLNYLINPSVQVVLSNLFVGQDAGYQGLIMQIQARVDNEDRNRFENRRAGNPVQRGTFCSVQ